MHPMSKPMGLLYGWVVGLATWLSLVALVAADDNIRTITLSGRALPGFGSDQVSHTTTFGDAVLNSQGQVAYLGQLAGPGIEFKNRDSYWRYSPNQGLELLARSGDPAPGRPGEFFAQILGPVKINDAGNVELLSHLADANGGGALWQHLGDWVWTPNGIVKLAYINERTPQIAHYFQPTGSSINELDQQIRGAVVQPSGGILPHNESLWLVDPTVEPRLIAKAGDPAPGIASAVLATEFSGFFWSPGRMMLRIGIAGRGVNATNNLGYWLGDGNGGNLQLIIRNGAQAPGLPAGTAIDFSTFWSVRELGTGAVQFVSLLSGPGINGSNDAAIWSYRDGGMQLLAREGDQAPGLASGVVFQQVAAAFRVAGPGIDASNNMGIWLQESDGLKLAVREGDQAPGTPAGVVFSTSIIGSLGTEYFVYLGGGVLQNKAEQFAFEGYLSGPGVNDANDVGLWASGGNGLLQLIVREGEQLDVDDGPAVDMRTIASITNQSLNDRGQVLFWATFTDGSKGLYLSDQVAVPEPNSFSLLLFTAIALCTQTNRRRQGRSCGDASQVMLAGIGPISSGTPAPPSAVISATCLLISGLSGTIPPLKSVWIAPGATTLSMNRRGPSSLAR
jgi:hypothetical protein